MAENKTKANKTSVTEFLSTVTHEQKRKDSETLVALFEKLIGEPAVMWGSSIIGFGQYHYKYASGREGQFMLAGFSPRKNALTIYIMTGLSQYADLLAQLGKYKTGKSCLYIKKLEDIDIDVLSQLILHSVDAVKKKYS